MADSVEISFVDENDFVKEGKWYKLYITRTSGETDARFRLKLKITLVESTHPSQRPDGPSLSPYFLLISMVQKLQLYNVDVCVIQPTRCTTAIVSSALQVTYVFVVYHVSLNAKRQSTVSNIYFKIP